MGQLLRTRQAPKHEADTGAGRHAAVLADLSPRGRRLQALTHVAQRHVTAVAQRKLSMPERLKLAEDSEVYKRIAGVELYNEMLEAFTTADEVRQVFDGLKGTYANAWAVATNTTGLQLARSVTNPAAKELPKFKVAIRALLPAVVVAPTTGPVWKATTAPSKPAPTLVLGASASVGESGNAMPWPTVRDTYLTSAKKPTGVTGVAKGSMEATSAETKEIAVTAQTPAGRLEVVLHYHPDEKGNYLHFKASRDADENYQVTWQHWLVKSAGIGKKSFA